MAIPQRSRTPRAFPVHSWKLNLLFRASGCNNRKEMSEKSGIKLNTLNKALGSNRKATKTTLKKMAQLFRTAPEAARQQADFDGQQWFSLVNDAEYRKLLEAYEHTCDDSPLDTRSAIPASPEEKNNLQASVPRQPHMTSIATPDIFTFVDRRLTQVSYLKLSPPIDVTERDPPEFCRIRPERFRIPPPRPMKTIFSQLAVENDKLRCGTVEFRERLAEYFRRAKEGRLGHRDELRSHRDIPQYRVFSQLVSDKSLLDAARKKAFEDFLTRSNGFHFNKPCMAACRFEETRNHSESPSLLIKLQLTDYFTYRVIGEASQRLGDRFWLDSAPRAGPHLSGYLAGHFQRNVHTGVGLEMVVHTIRDNRIVITRRSPSTGNRAGEPGKYFESVCEGLKKQDINPNYSHKLKQLREVIKWALNEELIGDDPLGRHLLSSQIRRCYVTGAHLYFPDASINLCGFVSIDCSADDIRCTFPYARDSHFESSIINESQWDARSGLPEFSLEGICRFIKGTLEENRPASHVWHEGSLVTVMLSTLALSEMG